MAYGYMTFWVKEAFKKRYRIWKLGVSFSIFSLEAASYQGPLVCVTFENQILAHKYHTIRVL